MKHIQILVEAKLLISRKSGRTRELFFNSAPIQMIYDRWSDEYSAFWATQAVDLKRKAEQTGATGSAARAARKPRKKSTPRGNPKVTNER